MSFTKEQAKEIATKIGIDWDKVDFNPKDFLQGLKVELEHGKKDKQTNVTNNDPEETGKITLAHLKEDPAYYTKLAKLEKSIYPDIDNLKALIKKAVKRYQIKNGKIVRRKKKSN